MYDLAAMHGSVFELVVLRPEAVYLAGCLLSWGVFEPTARHPSNVRLDAFRTTARPAVVSNSR